jgi:hypothetical protein
VAEHVVGQSIPLGVLVTVPLPAPATLTVSWDTPLTKPWHPTRAATEASASTPTQNLPSIETFLLVSENWM